MLLPHTELWQIFLSRQGGYAVRFNSKNASPSDQARQEVNTKSALEAWVRLRALLPPRCKLYVYLDSDVARLRLVAGSEALSERDWHTLAQTQISADEMVALDETWRSGKRIAVVIDRALVEQLRESGNVASVELTSVVLLTQAKFRAGTSKGTLQVRDAGGWTIAGFDGRRCLALTSYPAAATETQIEAESKRLALSAGMEADTKCAPIAARPQNIPLRLRGLFHFDILRRTRTAMMVAALSVIAFIAVVIVSTQGWDKVGKQAEVVRFKRKQLQELSQAIGQQRAALEASAPVGEPSELQMNWEQTLTAFEAIATPVKGITALDFTAKASSKTARLSVDVQKEALPSLYERLSRSNETEWRVASVSKGRDANAAAYQVLLIKEGVAGN